MNGTPSQPVQPPAEIRSDAADQEKVNTNGDISIPGAPVPAVSRKRTLPPLLLPVIVIFIAAGAVSLFVLKSRDVGSSVADSTPTPTRPTVNSGKHPVATTSAYTDVVTQLGEIDKRIQSYDIRDQSFSPPVLDLPLGFAEE